MSVNPQCHKFTEDPASVCGAGFPNDEYSWNEDNVRPNTMQSAQELNRFLDYTYGALGEVKMATEDNGFGCKNGAMTPSTIPYWYSFHCAAEIDRATYYQKCNAGKTNTWLCAASVTAFANAYKAQMDKCDPVVNEAAKNIRDNYALLMAEYYKASNNSVGNCVSFIPKEKFCGFQDLASQTKYCTSIPTDPCCPKLTTTTASVAPTAVAPVVKPSPSPSPIAKADDLSFSNPAVLYGSIGGGIVILLGIIIGIVMCMRKGKNNKNDEYDNYNQGGYGGQGNGQYGSQARGGDNYGSGPNDDYGAPVQTAETVEVLWDYQAERDDEIDLNVGDTVILKCKFDDGWAFGFNVITKREGSFPMACVAEPENQKRNNKKKGNINNRGSSLYVPR